MEVKNRIVLNVPHSSNGGLDTARWQPVTEAVKAVNTWTDWQTNIIFRPNPEIFGRGVASGRKGVTVFGDGRISMHVFWKNRFVVDAERLLNDSMEKIGQGIVYEWYDCRPQMDVTLKREVTADERVALYLEREEHLRGMEAVILANDEAGYGNCVVDCHSFPEFKGDVDICIGYNEDYSRPTDAVLGRVKDIFTEAGMSVWFNKPYSNSLTPVLDENRAKLRHGYKSLMIEVNKRKYLADGCTDLRLEWTRIGDCINAVYEYLAEIDL